MNIIFPEIEEYLGSLLPGRESWFIEMEKKAEEEGFPAVGPQVGMLLEILARAINAKRVMELGSGFGYSGLWFSRALPEDGYLLLSDFDEKNRELAEKYFKLAGKSKIMEFRVGDAMVLLEQLEQSGHTAGSFDIIFNDIDKEFYPRVIEPAYRLLRKGGLFITDNTLWDGKVVQDNPDKTTGIIKEFNKLMQMQKGFLPLQIPIRDGVCVALKVKG